MTNDVKVMTDGAAVALGVSNFMEWLPPTISLATGVLTIVWLALRIYETNTVQKMLGKDAVN
jgi:Flp pilus assembly protein protease CpaA